MNFPELKKNKQLQIEGLTDCQTGDRKIHTIRKFQKHPERKNMELEPNKCWTSQKHTRGPQSHIFKVLKETNFAP